MIASLKPYFEQKDSGVPWIGRVPAHWERRRLKTLLHVIDRRSTTGAETLLSLRREHGIVPYADHFSRPSQGETTVGYKLVAKGQLVLNRLQANNGLVFDSSLNGLVSPDYSVFEARGSNVVMPFLSQLLRTSLYRDHFRREATGLGTGSAGFLRLYDDRFLDTVVVLPPYEEQREILRFLAVTESKVWRYVSAKQRLVKLLEEQKQAIVHRAVTRGLDPSVRLKPSGIEWIDMVPAHWQVVALKRVLKRLVDCEHNTAPAVDQSEYRVVRTTAVRDGRIRWAGTYCTTREAFEAWTQRAVPESDDVIFTREAPAGEACVIPEGVPVCLGQRTVLMKLRREEYDPRFLVHMIYAGPPRHQIQIASQGSTVGHFNMDDIGWMPVFAPPLTEQLSILGHIDSETSPLTAIIDRTEREIALLRDYRTRLVSDAVTGKLDVRDAVASQLDDFEVEERQESSAVAVEDSDDVESELTEAFE